MTVNVDTWNKGAYPAGALSGKAPNVTTKLTASRGAPGNPVSYASDITDGSGGCKTLVFNGTVVPGVTLGDQVCVDVSIDKDTGFSDGFATAGSQAYHACAKVSEQAYLTINNSSVWAGGGFDPAPNGYGTGWCNVPGGSTNGFIATAQRTSGSPATTIGAYSEYAVGATAAIEQFSSSTMPTVPVPVPVNTNNTLTFANTPALGSFNGQGRCITDLYKYLSHDTTKTGISLATAFPTVSGQYFTGASTNMTISNQTIPASRQITLIVDGNVNINQNIVYSNYTANSKAEVPSFILVATGNINIASEVSRLDGLYFSKGDINTCSDVTGKLNNADCSNQLIVNGAFLASDIQFRRTHGGVAGLNGSTEPAEVFNFSDEMYLSQPILISEFPTKLSIDNIIDKPPVVN